MDRRERCVGGWGHVLDRCVGGYGSLCIVVLVVMGGCGSL